MRLADAILGHIGEPAYAERRVDWVHLDSAQALRTRRRHETADGTPIGLRLPRDAYLFDGAVLAADDQGVIAVARAPEAAVTITLADGLDRDAAVAQAGALAHALGNHHLPVEIDGLQLRTPLRATSEAVVRRLVTDAGVDARVETGSLRLGCARPLLGARSSTGGAHG